MLWDVFISHASEDKAAIARPLAESLAVLGVRVWLDAFELRPGDSLRDGIDRGLQHSHLGVVVLSPAFFKKRWTRMELGAMTAVGKRILPIWHNVSSDNVSAASPLLADIVALSSSIGISEVALRIAAEIPGALRGSAQSTERDARVQDCVSKLRGRDPMGQMFAVQELAHIGRSAQTACPDLCAMLDKRDWKMAMLAAVALGNIGCANSEVVTALKSALSSSSWMVRRAAVNSLGQLGGPAREAEEALRNALTDSQQEVQEAARLALPMISVSKVGLLRERLAGSHSQD